MSVSDWQQNVVVKKKSAKRTKMLKIRINKNNEKYVW